MMSMTRRHLLTTATGVTLSGALPVPPGLLTATPEPPALPPPLSSDVFRERQSQLKAAAKARGWNALFVTPSANLTYAANLPIGRSERLTALILLVDGPAILLTPSFEEANHRRDAVVDEIRTWKEEEDPIALAAKVLREKRAIGLEGSTPYSTASMLSSANGGKLEDATALFDSLRMVKSKDEQAFIREAARRTNLAIGATHKRMRGGMSEREVSRILEEEFSKLGVRGGGLVQFGPSSALPHGSAGDRRLSKGDAVLIDCGCKVRSYNSDLTRTVGYGAPSEEFRKVYAIVDRAQMAGIEALKTGASGEDVDRAARKVIEDAGYGPNFTHRLGHGLGLDGHELPYLVAGNRKPLAVGNTVTIEPGVYIPGRFGVRIEDDYAAGESGAVSLSVRPGDMVVISV